jgi:hypothetical protein
VAYSLAQQGVSIVNNRYNFFLPVLFLCRINSFSNLHLEFRGEVVSLGGVMEWPIEVHKSLMLLREKVATYLQAGTHFHFNGVDTEK